MSISDQFRSLPGAPARQVGWFSVVGLADDPSGVIISDGDTSFTAVCLDGYRRRGAGDRVLAELLSQEWVVLGKLSADLDPAPVAAGSLQLAAVSAGGWSASGLARDNPATGSPSSLDDWLGAWFWGGAITAGIAGRAVTAMTLTLTRLDGEGPAAPVIVRPALHAEPYRRLPTPIASWSQGLSATQGQALALPVPAAQREQLAAGTATGFVVTGSGPTETAAYDQAAVLTVSF